MSALFTVLTGDFISIILSIIFLLLGYEHYV